mgnify:CR=1 FL=1
MHNVRVHKVFSVNTIETKEMALEACWTQGDNWAEVVQARIMYVHDLPAAEATHHQCFSINFRTKKQVH